MADQQLQKRLLTRFLSKEVPPIPHDDERIIYPEKLNPFSWLFFWWLHPVMKTGYKRTLVVDDLFKLNEKVKVEALNDTFESHMYSAIDKAKAEHLRSKKSQQSESERISSEKDMEGFRHPRFVALWALIKTFPLQYGLACFFMILTNCAGACNPLLARKLIEFVQRKTGDDNVNNGKGVGYALGCSFMVLAVGILFNHAFMNSMLTGCQAKGVLIKSILNKSFRLSGASRVKYPSSKITALMGMDVSRIEFALGWQPILIAFPFSLGISIGILIYNIGPVSLVGVGMILVYLVVISFAVSRVYRFRIRANKYTDIRVGLVKEILNNLKAIKFYCWEDAYEKQVIETRSQEMKYVLRMQQTRSLVVGTSVCMTLFASMTSFLTLYATSGSTRDPASLFSSISLFNNLASQIIVLPAALSSGSDAIIGIMRLSEYFAAEEGSDIKEQRSFQEKSTLAVSITNASFKWDGSSGGNDETVSVSSTLTDDKASTSSCTPKSNKFDGLRDINLSIAHGQFVVVTGMIGSGKSALLNSIAGFIPLASGHLSVEGSLLLCEHHWIQNTTVKENILFGKDYDEKRYNDTIYACSLESDLEILPAGDQTEIGERGITLSGGQKARISLARAVYADNDIILLDDVLSAVDAKVAKHIMTNCVLGLLATKTRILATHQISLIGSSDMVVFLNGDGTIDHGTMEDLKQRNTNFRNLMALGANTKTLAKANDSDEEEVEGRQDKESETNDTNDSEAVRKNFNVNKGEDGKLTKEERKAVNSIKFDVYKRYIKNGSGIFPVFSVAIFVFMSEVLAHVCEIMTNTWLSFWADYRFRHKGDHFYIGIYIMFTFCAYFFLIFAFLALAYLTNTSAEVLNLKAMHRVLHAPMSLMDVTPMGRMLNRFTKDSDVLDNEINNDLRVLIYFIGSIFGILVLCIIYLPYFAIAVPFLGFLFVAIGNFYQASAREIKRLEAVQRSFVYNNFNEILSGMMTIKAYNAEARFKRKNDVYINKTNEASYLTVANQRWLSIHLDIVASLFAVIISLLCVFRVFKISAASTGLLLSYVLSIAGSLSVLIRTLTQVENQMNSVERLCEYGFDLEQEAPYVISETKPSPTWPNEGAISFENVSLAYRPNLPLVLKNLTLDVKPYEKIGICGRTGAGKSSIMTALYRLVELKEGKIEIDGVDISKLGLKDLRSHLSIIPQDPVLFKGTIRKNLDPFDNFTEAELWKSLVSAGLVNESEVETAQTNQDIKFHLKKEVEENGVNFSLGERQLLAFARALVRKTKLLILDEATSSVDYKTDNRIQQTIAEHFKRCTVLCIAHRLKTILSYDRIVVLDNGEIVECGTPKDLYMITDSNFRQMCEKSGISDKDFV